MKVIKTMNIAKLILFFCISFLHSVSYAQQNVQEKSATEIRALQTRVIDSPTREVYRAMISVLQDNKYKITGQSVNEMMTVIIAQGTPSATETSSRASTLIPFIGSFIAMTREEAVESWTVNVTIEDPDDKKKSSSIRLVITSQITKAGLGIDAAQRISNSDLSDRPEVYQDLFSKLERELLVRKSLR